MDAPREDLVAHDPRFEDQEAKIRWFLGLTMEERLLYADSVMAPVQTREDATGNADGTPVTARVVRLPRAP